MKNTKITITLMITENTNFLGSVMNHVKEVVCNAKTDCDIDFLGVTGNIEFQETRIEEINGIKYQIIKSKI